MEEDGPDLNALVQVTADGMVSNLLRHLKTSTTTNSIRGTNNLSPPSLLSRVDDMEARIGWCFPSFCAAAAKPVYPLGAVLGCLPTFRGRPIPTPLLSQALRKLRYKTLEAAAHV